MRQATAVITAEKGLNSSSRIKLESLAKHLKLPPELFEEALVLLQSNDNLNLTHYEKAFVKFLDTELGRIKGGVISLGMEFEAIDLADRKYQINSTRAEQLIKSRAKAAGISRISPDEAAVFAERIIVERTNKLAAVDDELREDLYRIGKKWGYQREQVDRVIFREISQNRAQKRSAFFKRAAALLCLVVAAGVGTAIATGHLEIDLFSKPLPADPVANLDQPGQVSASEPDQAPSTFANLKKFAQSRNARPSNALNMAVEKIGQNDASQRQTGFHELSKIACSDPQYDGSELTKLIARLYYEEQSDAAASGVLSAIRQRLEIQSPTSGVSVKDLKNNYRANGMLGQICFSDFADNFETTSRYQNARAVIEDLIRIPVSNELTLADYLSRSEAAIAVDQWNLLNQTIWSPTSIDAAVLYGPILSLTKPKLDPKTLNSYRDESLISMIEVDSSDWNHLKAPIRETLSRCDEGKLNRWISAFVKPENQAMQDFLSPLLLKRIDVKPKSVVRKDVYDAIAEYEIAVRDRLIKPVTTRDADLSKQIREFLSQQPLPKKEITPDQIASTALRVNLQMAFCAALEDVSHIDESSFVEFDRINETVVSGPLRLRELISLPIDRSSEQESKNAATASDRARKKAAIARLSLSGRDSSGSRKLALNQLAKVALRFERLTYAESETLAQYLLSDLGTEELLNAQLRIESFAHWPNLALAIADNLPNSDAGVDQALTVCRLLLGQEFEFQPQDKDWKLTLQSKLYVAIADQISNQVDLDPDNTKNSWNRLQIYLNDIYGDRLMIINKANSLNQSFSSLDQTSLELTRVLALQQNRVQNSNLKRSQTIVAKSSSNEIARTVLAGQFLIQVVSSEFESTELSARAQDSVSRFQTNMASANFVGEQLYYTELALLRLFALKRELLVRQLRERG